MGRWTLDTSQAYVAMDLLSRVMSPYDLNPFGSNPLISVLTECIDFERLAPHQSSLYYSLLCDQCAHRRGASFEIVRLRSTSCLHRPV